MMTRTGPHERSIMASYSGGSSRPSLRTARLITDQVTSTSRTCSTSISQREVSHAHGQSGSNHISTALVSPALTVTGDILPAGGPAPTGRLTVPTDWPVTVPGRSCEDVVTP